MKNLQQCSEKKRKKTFVKQKDHLYPRKTHLPEFLNAENALVITEFLQKTHRWNSYLKNKLFIKASFNFLLEIFHNIKFTRTLIQSNQNT